MPNLSAFCALSMVAVLTTSPALAQPAPGAAKEQRQSSTPKKMPAQTAAADRGIKKSQQEARGQHDRKMKQADTEMAMGIGSANQGMGGMPAKKSSSPGHVTREARKPALQPQSASPKK